MPLAGDLGPGASPSEGDALCPRDDSMPMLLNFAQEMLELGQARPHAHAEDAVPALVALLYAKASPVTQLAAAALSVLSGESNRHREIMVHAGAVPPLLRLVVQGSSAKAAAANVLCHVARCVDGCRALAEGGGVTPLTRLVAEGPDSEAAYWATGALWSLAEGSQANCDKIAEAGAVEPLVAIITFPGVKASVAGVAGGALRALLANGLGAGLVGRFVEAAKNQCAEPPLAFPDIMQLLQEGAKGQLAMAQEGDNVEQLQSAIAFGRWVRLPTLMLGAARNRFKAVQAEKDALVKTRERKLAMGMGRAKGGPREERRAPQERGSPGGAGPAAGARGRQQQQPAGGGSTPPPAKRRPTRGGGGRRPSRTPADDSPADAAPPSRRTDGRDGEGRDGKAGGAATSGGGAADGAAARGGAFGAGLIGSAAKRLSRLLAGIAGDGRAAGAVGLFCAEEEAAELPDTALANLERSVRSLSRAWLQGSFAGRPLHDVKGGVVSNELGGALGVALCDGRSPSAVRGSAECALAA